MSEDPILDNPPNSLVNPASSPPSLQEPLLTPPPPSKIASLTLKEALRLSLTMGVLSFGGPVAHIGLFHKSLIEKNSLVSDKVFTQLFALCNILPGPTSSQLLTAIFLLNTRSVAIGVYSFLCFNMPALLLLFLIAFALGEINPKLIEVLSNGIRQAAVAVVLQAAITLGQKILNSRFQVVLAVCAFFVFLFWNEYLVMVLIMIVCATASLIYRKDFEKYAIHMEESSFEVFKSMKFLGLPSFLTFVASYFVIIFIDYIFGKAMTTVLMESFYRMGSLVIGGGHVIIPMIFSEFTHDGILTETQVLDSFAMISLMPGPMFNLAGYLGFKLAGFFTGLVSALCIFMPGMLLLFTGLGFMSFINKSRTTQLAIRGISSAAIGFICVGLVMMWVETIMGLDKKGGKGEFFLGAFKSLLVAFYWFLLERVNLHVLLVFLISLLVSILLKI